jgi:Rrf2 family nitric oxide-sensitive transcriptional repressor
MQLTKFTDLGLRVLMYLSQNRSPQTIMMSEISEALNVKYSHLIKVVTFLNKQAWIQTVRGPGGGMRLVVEPSQLLMGDVLRVLEGSSTLVDCIKPTCPLSGLCGLKSVLDEGLEAFYQHMNTHTLQDVLLPQTVQAISVLHHRYAKAV